MRPVDAGLLQREADPSFVHTDPGAAVADRIAAYIEQVASRYAVDDGEAGW
jgi:hypothetical protein